MPRPISMDKFITKKEMEKLKKQLLKLEKTVEKLLPLIVKKPVKRKPKAIE